MKKVTLLKTWSKKSSWKPRINFQKWHSKVRIVISKDFEFEVIALIDSGADLNYIQEGIIPSKYFRKTRERLTSASGGKMQIEFKIPKAHVCQDNTCFKTTFVLVKNMTDRVILGNPLMCLLYSFTVDGEGITTQPFGQPVKFKFLRYYNIYIYIFIYSKNKILDTLNPFILISSKISLNMIILMLLSQYFHCKSLVVSSNWFLFGPTTNITFCLRLTTCHLDFVVKFL